MTKIIIANQDAVASTTVADLGRISVVMSTFMMASLTNTCEALLMKLSFLVVCRLVKRRQSVGNTPPSQGPNAR